jgi:hypothetical protein
MSKLETATIRDFSGGWNVADDEYNLNSKYQPVSDNLVVGVDNTLSIRYGYKLLYDFETGAVSAPVTGTFLFAYTDVSPRVVITATAHPFNDGDHITISGAVSQAGIPVADLNGSFNIRKIDADSFEIQTRTPANTTTTGNQTITYVRDTHQLGAPIREASFFQGFLHVVDANGEIVAVDWKNGTFANIWNIAKAHALPGNPAGWRRARLYSHDTFKQTLILVNGKNNDKPIEIRHTRSAGAITQYLVDPASSSNANVYAADLVKAFGGYVILGNPNNTSTPTTNSPSTIDISAEGTSGVFVGNSAPDDAVQVDLGIVTNTVDPTITAIGNIRDNVFVAFYDTALLGKLGLYVGGNHEPEFKDQVPQHGALNHRVLHTIGNDLFMCDYFGVPSFSQSIQSGSIVPERLSMFVDPVLNAHLGRLSQRTLREDVWALFNVRDKQYMLFVPKHDEQSTFNGEDNPFYVTDTLKPLKQVIVYARNHTVMAGDRVVISGAVNMMGLAATDINGTRDVKAIIDENYFVIEVGAEPIVAGVSGGGTVVQFAPLNDETIGYIYQYNPALRIRRWTRFRGLKFSCGCLTNDGRIIVCEGRKVYQLGTVDEPIHGDEVGVFDAIWQTSTTYTKGTRVKESSGASFIYECTEDTTSGTGTFSEEVEASSVWQVYNGRPITFTMETPWSDMRDREIVKIVRYLRVDAKGRGQFTVQGYTDSMPIDRSTYERVPNASMQFVGQDSLGFGLGNQPFGGGRNTRSQLQFGFPLKGKLIKLRAQGQSAEPLKLISLSMLYLRGSIYR